MTSQIRAWEVTDTRDQAERASERTIPRYKTHGHGGQKQLWHETPRRTDSRLDARQAKHLVAPSSWIRLDFWTSRSTEHIASCYLPTPIMLPFLTPASPLPFRKLRRFLPRLEAALDLTFLLRITGVNNHCGVLMAGSRPGRSRPRGAGEHVVRGGGVYIEQVG